MRSVLFGILVNYAILLIPACNGEGSQEATGACCLPNGTCSEWAQSTCQNNGGEFQGLSLSCAEANCKPQCTSDQYCQVSEYCDDGGHCQEGCRTDPDNCAEGECDPSDHTCKIFPCESDSDCGGGEYCDVSGDCLAGCRTDPDNCTEGECDPADHNCKPPPCSSDLECEDDEYCDASGDCLVGCRTDPDNCGEEECDPVDHTCQEPAFCAEMRAQIQQFVDERLVNDVVHYAGLVVGVDTPVCGTSVFTSGLAVVDPEELMDPKYILPVASVSKTFLSAVVLQLVEEGELSLDDTLSNWRTDIPYSDQITVRQMLNHTSGIKGYMFTNCNNLYLADPDLVWTPEELLDCIDGVPPSFVPGTSWRYSNSNYVLLGLIVEAITGNELHVEVRNRILDPLGLSHTFSLFNEEPVGEVAHSYEFNDADQTWVDITDNYNYSFYWACGGMASSTEDLLVWIRQLMTGSVLQESSLAEMMTCTDDGDAFYDAENWDWTGYGLALMCGEHEIAGSTFGHGGAIETAVTSMHYVPAWDSFVVVQVNHCYDFSHPTYQHDIDSAVISILGEYY